MKYTEFCATAVFLSLIVAATQPAIAGNKRLYQWTDDQGNVHYSDKVPPEASKKERRVLDEQGLMVDKLDRAKTSEEIAEEKRQQKIREAQEEKAREQAERDRVLLNTYESEQDIVNLRDSKVQTVENIIQISQRRKEKLQERLQSLMHRAADLERAGKPVTGDLESRIANTRGQILKTDEFIDRKKGEQTEIRKDYEKDIQRYRELQAEMNEQRRTAPN
jgi:hypothetical protein